MAAWTTPLVDEFTDDLWDDESVTGTETAAEWHLADRTEPEDHPAESSDIR